MAITAQMTIHIPTIIDAMRSSKVSSASRNSVMVLPIKIG